MSNIAAIREAAQHRLALVYTGADDDGIALAAFQQTATPYAVLDILDEIYTLRAQLAEAEAERDEARAVSRNLNDELSDSPGTYLREKREVERWQQLHSDACNERDEAIHQRDREHERVVRYEMLVVKSEMRATIAAQAEALAGAKKEIVLAKKSLKGAGTWRENALQHIRIALAAIEGLGG